MRSFKVGLAVLALVIALTPSAFADIITVGSLTGNQIRSTPGTPWVNAFTISWEVTQTGALWTYKYSLSAPRKEMSHWILSVSKTFTEAQIGATSTPNGDLDLYELSTDPKSSNPADISAKIYGIKWDRVAATNGKWVYTLVTPRAPVWGSFFAKDGNYSVNGIDVKMWAYNTGFNGAFEGLTATPTDGLGYIVRPDTSEVVPEPASMLLLGTGLLGAGLLRRRQNQK